MLPTNLDEAGLARLRLRLRLCRATSLRHLVSDLSSTGREPCRSEDALVAVEEELDALAAEEGGERGPEQVGVFVAARGERVCRHEGERGERGEGESCAGRGVLDVLQREGCGGAGGEEADGGEEERGEGVGCSLFLC